MTAVQFITILVSAVGVAISYAMLRNVRGKLKRLHYTTTWTPFLLPFREDEEILRRIKILTSGHEFINPTLVVVRFENTGWAPIEPDDFDGPIKLLFGEYAYFIFGTIEVTPKNLVDPERTKIKWQKGDLSIEPFLLNPRDQITLTAVVDGFPEEVEVLSRISGIEEINRVPKPNDDGFDATATATSLLGLPMDEWPSPGPIESLVTRIPLVIDPGERLLKGVAVYVDEQRFNNPYCVTVHLQNKSNRTVRTGAESLILTTGSETDFKACELKINDIPVNGGRRRRDSIRMQDKKVSISPPDLDPGDKFDIRCWCNGPGKDIHISQQPSWVKNIVVYDLDFTECYEQNLGKTSSRVLLTNDRLYRYWYRIEPKLSRNIRRISQPASAKLKKLRNRLPSLKKPDR